MCKGVDLRNLSMFHSSMLRHICLQFPQRQILHKIIRSVFDMTCSSVTVMSRQSLSSWFRLRLGDRSNRTDYGRCPLLVRRRIWQTRAPFGSPFRRHRHYDHHCSYFTHCPRTLLLSDMVDEQPVILALLYHRHRMST